MLMVTAWRWLAAAVVPLLLAGCTGGTGPSATGTGTASRPGRVGTAAPGGHRGLAAVRHVWVIELENQGYAQSFGTPAADPYLAQTLPRMGALLENYYAIGHASADNYIAQVSGQAPTLATQADCPFWIPFPGHVVAGRITRFSARAASIRRRSPRSATSYRPPGAAGRRTCRTWAMTQAGTTRSAPPADRHRARPLPPQRALAREERPRRRQHRRGPAVPAHQARYRQRRSVQPLLAAAHHRGHLRPAAPRRRRHAPGTVLRPRRIRLTGVAVCSATRSVAGIQGFTPRLRA